jgi:molecular chaperone GrpE
VSDEGVEVDLDLEVDQQQLDAAAEVIEADIADVGLIAKERDDYLALAQRLQAEFENYKKQTMRRNTEIVENAGAHLAQKLLPVLEAFDNAIIHGIDGVGPLHKALFDVLQKEGLEVIPTDGVVFDPNQHEAVMHEPADDDDDEPVVIDTLRTGYTWRGRVVRPAMVKVRG